MSEFDSIVDQSIEKMHAFVSLAATLESHIAESYNIYQQGIQTIDSESDQMRNKAESLFNTIETEKTDFDNEMNELKVSMEAVNHRIALFNSNLIAEIDDLNSKISELEQKVENV